MHVHFLIISYVLFYDAITSVILFVTKEVLHAHTKYYLPAVKPLYI
jgi:hypothetical protein